MTGCIAVGVDRSLRDHPRFRVPQCIVRTSRGTSRKRGGLAGLARLSCTRGTVAVDWNQFSHVGSYFVTVPISAPLTKSSLVLLWQPGWGGDHGLRRCSTIRSPVTAAADHPPMKEECIWCRLRSIVEYNADPKSGWRLAA